MTEQLEGQISMFDLASPSGKTSQEHSVPIKEQTSKPSCKPCATSKEKTFMYLNLKNGNLLGASWETVGALPGESMTLNFGESPNAARESTLSQILDLNAPEKYCLSKKACLGILRRAEKRGKVLPDMLMEALMEAVRNDPNRQTGLQDRSDE